MNQEAQEELILRHLDRDTSPTETVQVTKLLKEDPDFRSRFFNFASLLMELQELVGIEFGGPNLNVNGNPPMQALKSPPQETEAVASVDARQIYLNAVLGGFGGLLGFLIISLLGGLSFVSALGVYWKDALILGPGIGIGIGFAVGAADGLFASRSWQRLWRGGRFGALLGALGGIVGLVLGELLLAFFGGGVWSRALGWGVFGMLVGTSDGVARRMPVKIRYGVLGGLLGGLIGGSTYELILGTMRGGAARTWGSAIGLVILGACIGLLVSLVESLLRKAWVFFLTGRLEGQTRTLDSSRPHTIGSDPGCDIVIVNDPSVSPVHAEIGFSGGEFEVRSRDGQVLLRRDGFDQFVVAQVLAAGDRIILGDTRMVFRNVEGRKS
ncbi:MAG: FHA domain-containing protein [Gemmataceae bacterium]